MTFEIVGISEHIEKIRRLTKRVAPFEPTTLVCGESGVGKELVVQNLYHNSRRFGKPFVKVNCASLPDTLIESEIFGYEQGAFTGAQRKKQGVFQQADGGVLFLDEIGEMPLILQPKLLHVLQNGEYTPLGSEQPQKSDVWVIAATNCDLEEDMNNGKFRQDLFYRLSTIKIFIEPLRKRPEDIPYLIHHFIREYALQFKEKKLKFLDKKIMQQLVKYHWPGNVRELQNVLRRIMILGNNQKVLEEILSSFHESDGISETQNYTTPPSLLLDLIYSDKEKIFESGSICLKEIKKKAADHIEKNVISSILVKTGWNRFKASKMLNISYRSLLGKIQELQISPSESWN